MAQDNLTTTVLGESGCVAGEGAIALVEILLDVEHFVGVDTGGRAGGEDAAGLVNKHIARALAVFVTV